MLWAPKLLWDLTRKHEGIPKHGPFFSIGVFYPSYFDVAKTLESTPVEDSLLRRSLQRRITA